VTTRRRAFTLNTEAVFALRLGGREETDMADVEKTFVLVAQETPHAGGATYWSLHDDMNLDALKTAWLANGLPQEWLPEKPSVQVAFGRAVKELEGHDTEVEMVDSTGEWLLQSREEVDGLPVRTPLAKWRLDENGVPVMTFGDSTDLHDVMLASFEFEKGRITSGDASKWLRRLVDDELDSIPLRWNGGFYYIPPTQTDTMQRIKEALKTATAHRVQILPMFKNDDAVEAIMTSSIENAKKEAEKLITDLEANKDGNGKIKGEGLRNRAERAEAIKAQMQRYAAMLGVAVPEIADSIEKLSAGLFVAAAKADQLNG
jgi:hypothetical protein